MTQTWLMTEAPVGDGLMYEAVSCLACSRQHFVCVASGQVLGDNVPLTPTNRGPVFPPKQIQLCHDRAGLPRDSGRQPPIKRAPSRIGDVHPKLY
jgi:hypothetical protein